MKKFASILIIAFLLFPLLSFATERVRGQWRDTNRDGVKDSYADSYKRTSPNSTKRDNYSTRKKYNPNKGEFTPGNSDSDSSQDYYKTKKKYY